MNKWINFDLDAFDPRNPQEMEELHKELDGLRRALAGKWVYFRGNFAGDLDLRYAPNLENPPLPLSPDAQNLVDWGFAAPEIFAPGNLKEVQNNSAANGNTGAFSTFDNAGNRYDVVINYNTTDNARDFQKFAIEGFDFADEDFDAQISEECLLVRIVKFLEKPVNHELRVPLLRRNEFKYRSDDHQITAIFWEKQYFMTDTDRVERQFWTGWQSAHQQN